MSQLTSPRWTHVALPSVDIDQSVAWYQKFTPLVVVERFEDQIAKERGYSGLSHSLQLSGVCPACQKPAKKK